MKKINLLNESKKGNLPDVKIGDIVRIINRSKLSFRKEGENFSRKLYKVVDVGLTQKEEVNPCTSLQFLCCIFQE